MDNIELNFTKSQINLKLIRFDNEVVLQSSCDWINRDTF